MAALVTTMADNILEVDTTREVDDKAGIRKDFLLIKDTEASLHVREKIEIDDRLTINNKHRTLKIGAKKAA